MKSFYVVTPVLNAATLIGQTMQSVLSQAQLLKEDFEIFYCVMDGGSDDDTVKIIQEFIKNNNSIANIHIEYVSQKDAGMYDAIASGFFRYRITDDAICCYINAGDYFSPYAFSVVSDLISEENQWLTGLSVSYNEIGHIDYVFTPRAYSNRLTYVGFNGRFGLPHIQQESTFWRGNMMHLIDFEKLRQMKFAGDAFIWSCFSKNSRLQIVRCWLAGFRKHHGQASKVYADRYREERYQNLPRPSIKDYLSIPFYWIVNNVTLRRFGLLERDAFRYCDDTKTYRRL